MEDHEGKKILVIQTHGVDTPTRTYSPLYYAVAAAAITARRHVLAPTGLQRGHR